jgi:hypothetical protein
MIYRHVQAGWLTGAAIGITALMLGAITVFAGFHWIVLVPALAIGLTVLTFSFMTVTVDERALEAKMGIGLVRCRVPVSDIVHFRAVRNPWYYGWGVRMYGGGKLYSVSGFEAVELLLATGRTVRIGTDEPGALVHAIERVAGVPAPLTTTQMQERQLRSRLGLVFTLALVLLPLAMMFYGRTQPPEVSINSQWLRLRGGGYSAEVPIRQIQYVSLEASLPPVKTRINGLSLLGTERGHFTLEQLGDARLFINRSYPPFVLIRTAGQVLAFNLPDEAQTRALYDKLVAARR